MSDNVLVPGTVIVEGPDPAPPGSGPGNPAQVTSLRADASPELRVITGACAVAWRIFLVAVDGSDATQIAFQTNADRDPAYARQNRFQLPLANVFVPDGPLELRARLSFPGLDVVATWQVVIVPFDRPEPLLRVRDTGRPIVMVEGCNVVMTLRNGQRDGPACPDDLSEALPVSTALQPGTGLVFGLEGWSVTEAVVICGGQSGLEFVAVPQPGCWQEPQEAVVFVAPEPDDWAVAVSACAVGFTQFASNRICGTWYAAIDTR